MVHVESRAPGGAPAEPPRAGLAAGSWLRLPGLAVALVLASVAVLLSRQAPVVGGPVFGIVLGALAAAAVPALRAERYGPGYDFASKTLLQLSIVILGTGLSLGQVAEAGGGSLPVMLGTLAVALGGAWLFGRLLGVHGDTRTLIGVGTAICGGSAIAAAATAIGAKRSSIAYALATIFTFNIAAVLVFPPVGRLLGLSPEAFGLWAGTAINDTSSVVAAGYTVGQAAGDHALVVKLTRSLMLIPIVVGLVILKSRREARSAGGPSMPWRRMVPLFLAGFLVAAALRSAGLIPAAWQPGLSQLGVFLITAALAGIGLSLRPADLRGAGPRPLLLGAVLWAAVAVSSLGLQLATGRL